MFKKKKNPVFKLKLHTADFRFIILREGKKNTKRMLNAHRVCAYKIEQKKPSTSN